MHTTGGYLLGAHLTTKYVFDLREDDVYWCTADIGWVTGHSYVVYGPLSNGATTVMYEGAPDHPEKDRFWSIIERHKVSIFYTAPTAIRAFVRWGDDLPKKHDLSSLRLLGSVGEPINPEAWMWYHEVIGGGRCPIVDTWWQTETGGIMMTPLPGITDAKPGSCAIPFFGVDPQVVKRDGTPCGRNEGGFLVIKKPWPSMLRGIHGDPERYTKAYWSEIPGVYFTGDGSRQDEDGYFWVMGRVDDVLNVAGHRLGTAEIESALVSHPSVAEAAVVGPPHELKGQAIFAFVTPEERRDRVARAEEVALGSRRQGDRRAGATRRDPLHRCAAEDPLGEDHAAPLARDRHHRRRPRRRDDAGRHRRHQSPLGRARRRRVVRRDAQRPVLLDVRRRGQDWPRRRYGLGRFFIASAARTPISSGGTSSL